MKTMLCYEQRRHNWFGGSEATEDKEPHRFPSINNDILFEMIKEHIQDEHVCLLVWQYLHQTVVYGENCCYYTRPMDDWTVIAETRWHLRRAGKMVNRALSNLKLEKLRYLILRLISPA